MKNIKHHLATLLFSAVVCGLLGCSKDDNCGVGETPTPGEEDEFFTGWDAEGEEPDSIQVFVGDFADCSGLPSSVMLTSQMPPIGNQGNYGTCVAWAVAYNTMTALEGNTYGLSSGQLADPAHQSSPKDLFYAIPDDLKGDAANNLCNGTQYFYALPVLQERGAATMQTVPYTNLGNCSSDDIQQSWENEAAQHKIDYYRRIDPPSVCAIKAQLAASSPVMFASLVGSNWQHLSDDRVFAEPPTGNIGGHAMTICGYDDGRQAFRVANSWGTGWGDGGYAWVGYDFMINEFISPGNLYFAVHSGNEDGPPDVNPNAGGVDLAAWVFSDIPTQVGPAPTQRSIWFNLYNIGTQTARASNDWQFMYMYYNAYNINDAGIFFIDAFNENVEQGTYEETSPGYFEFNFDIEPGDNFTNVVFGSEDIVRTYDVPPTLNGYYYLVLIADRTHVFDEANEFNNIFYTTGQWPKFFQNGLSNVTSGGVDDRSSAAAGQYQFLNSEQPSPALLQKNQFNTAVNEHRPNAYRPEEIIRFLKKQKATGELDQMIQEYRQRQANNTATGYRPK